MPSFSPITFRKSIVDSTLPCVFTSSIIASISSSGNPVVFSSFTKFFISSLVIFSSYDKNISSNIISTFRLMQLKHTSFKERACFSLNSKFQYIEKKMMPLQSKIH